MTTPASWRWPVLAALAAVAVYWNALGNGFAMDDVPLVRDNPSLASLASIPHLALAPYWEVQGEHYGLYRPVTTISLALNRAATGPGPRGFHLGNVLLHAAVVALAWYALRGSSTFYGTAWIGALLFAAHPLHAEAVANVAGRAELLSALFALAAWLAHRSGRRIVAAVLFLGAILSKEGAILAPLLFAADDRLREEHPPRLAAYAPYAAALAVMALLRIAALGPHQAAEATVALDNPAAAAGVLPRVLTALWVQVKYVGLLLWPHPLSSDYSFDAIPVVRSLLDPRALVGVVAACVGVAALAWGWKRSRPVALGMLVWIVFFLPASNLLFATGTLMAERLAYLPSLGACLIAGHALAAFAAGEGRGALARRVAVAGTVAAAAAALGGATWARNPAWKDNLTLTLRDVASQPRCAKLHGGAGIFLDGAGRSREAEDHLREAVAIDPTYAQMHFNLGVLLARRGADAEAEIHLRRAIELVPGNPRPYAVLASLLDRTGRADEAARVRASAPR